MRDITLMADTLRSVWMHGEGRAECLPACPRGVVWVAGDRRLNGQAVADLLADGWLERYPGATHAQAAGCPAWMVESA